MINKQFTRRVFIHGSWISVTALLLPGCVSDGAGIARIEQDGQFFSAEQLTLLNDIAEIMIPRTETPGAADARVVSVLDGMMLTWAAESSKQEIPAMLETVEQQARTEYDQSFDQLSLSQRTLLIETLDQQAFSENPPAGADGYKTLKFLVFRIFYTSPEGSADHVAIPGQYDGDLSLDEYQALMRARAHG